MKNRLLATAVCAVLTAAAATLSGAPAEASAPAAVAAAPHGPPCNAHGYEPKVRNVQGTTFVKLTRMAEKTYAGPTTIRKGFRIQSEKNWFIDANATAKGGFKVGAEGVFKKFVKVFSVINTEAQWTAQVTRNSSESKIITMHKRVRIPQATTVIFFAGWMGAKGTGEYSYCSALEGSGEGYVKWQKASWHTYGGHGSGAQNCRVKAYGKIAAAAKAAGCVG